MKLSAEEKKEASSHVRSTVFTIRLPVAAVTASKSVFKVCLPGVHATLEFRAMEMDGWDG